MTTLINRSDIDRNMVLLRSFFELTKKAPLVRAGPSLGAKQTTSGANDRTGGVIAGLGGLRVRGSSRPRLRRTSNRHRNDRHVLRRREAVERGRARCSAREISAVVVSGVLLFVGRQVAKVRLHRCDVRLVLGVGELRNRNRGKNADDDDYDQKLNECKTLFVAHHMKILGKEAIGKKRYQPYGADIVKTTGKL